MPHATPLQKSVELYNLLIKTPFSDQTTIWRLTSELKRLEQTGKGDFAVRVALMSGYMACGERASALSLIPKLHSQFKYSEIQAVEAYSEALINLMEFESAQEVLDWLMKTVPADVVTLQRSASAAFCTGDLARLDAVAELSARASFPTLAKKAAKAVRDNIGSDMFPSHMQLINDVWRGFVTYLSVSLDSDEDDLMTVFVNAFAKLPLDECFERERVLDHKLEDLYTGAGKSPGAFSPYICTALSPIEAAPRRRIV